MEFGPILQTLKRKKAFSSLIIIQVAITLVVMTTSVVVTTTTLKEWNLPSGLDAENIVAIYPQAFDEQLDQRQLVESDIKRLQQIPGVQLVSPAMEIPFAAGQGVDIFKSNLEAAQSFQTNIFDLNEHGLKILGVELKSGRDFNPDEILHATSEFETVSPSSVLISDALADALFGTESAIGQTLWLNDKSIPVKVIGVYSGFMNGEPLNYAGMSYRSLIRPVVEYRKGLDPNYLLRVEPGSDDRLLESIRKVMYQTQGRYIQGVEFLTRTQKRMYDGRGSRALIILSISFVLMIITALGISGLVSYLVAQQKKQIGTRRALGAKKWHIIRYYLLENSIVTSIGLLLGAGLTVPFLLLITEQSGEDFVRIDIMLGIVLFLWLVSTFAALFPARRAAQVDPAIVTRSA